MCTQEPGGTIVSEALSIMASCDWHDLLDALHAWLSTRQGLEFSVWGLVFGV
jgi:hypothetical protein